MRRSPILSTTITLTALLTACGSVPLDTQSQQTNQDIITAEQLQISSTVPVSVQQEMRSWYANLSDDMKKGITKNPLIMFQASDGKTYANTTDAEIRSGKLIEQGNSTFVRFTDGSADQGYVKTNSAATGTIGALNYSCNTTDGPYYRSWSLTGYSGSYSLLNLQSATLPSLINDRYVAAYSYLGGQVQGQSDADAGIVYLNGTLRVFKTDINGYNDVYARDLRLNTNYPVRFNVSGVGKYVLRVDRPDTGGSPVLVNLVGAGANYAGTGMYLKRMATIASNAFAGYTGNTKFNARSVTLISDSKLAKYVNGAYTYQTWSSSSINTSGCKWPNSTIVQVISGGATSDYATVDINMAR